VYRVVSVHGAAVTVRRLSEPYDGAPAVYAPLSSSTPCFDEVPRVGWTCIVGGYGEEREHDRKGAPTRSP
jgi:hypothetical protein